MEDLYGGVHVRLETEEVEQVRCHCAGQCDPLDCARDAVLRAAHTSRAAPPPRQLRATAASYAADNQRLQNELQAANVKVRALR
jgi:hypothetical protein